MTRLSTAFTIVLLLGALASAQGQQLPILNPNVATEPELLALPQLSPTLVKALIAHRPYKTMLEVNAQLSPALSKEQLSQLYVRLFLPIGLNTATRDEILLVPGVGPRMAHEFEEYRPYTSIDQFRKEIGKYVSRDEVARLERYVALR
jgi:DNA uptake protein ComE-like DNA-binding protein